MLPVERYEKLREYLSAENPVLLEAVDTYQKLDNVAYDIGLLQSHETFTESISWWPMISILGTFSAGKSSFINEYLSEPLQQCGNQAVDDKFTVICYGNTQEAVTLPGLALDADPRFPFYNISQEIERVEPGEGNRVNMYFQLKTLKNERIKGKILIDSPGFDADSQRDAVLRITDHMVEMSDLILVFFDARHPEPGAMRDTLRHLVATTIRHRDANKVLYILNQIDTTAQEDNLESVIASWQRALAKEGLVAGNFYAIYNQNAAVDIEDEGLRKRLQAKRDEDYQAIVERMEKVSIERSYRIVKTIGDQAETIIHDTIPLLREILNGWRRQVLWGSLGATLLLSVLLVFGGVETGIVHTSYSYLVLAGIISIVFIFIHMGMKNYLKNRLVRHWNQKNASVANAIAKQATLWRSIVGFGEGWQKKNVRRLHGLIDEAKRIVSKLNDRFVASVSSDVSEGSQD